MTKEEFKAARKSLGLNQEELAKKLDRSSRMIVHYETGTVKVPKIVKRLMEMILKENGNDRLHNSQ